MSEITLNPQTAGDQLRQLVTPEILQIIAESKKIESIEIDDILTEAKVDGFRLKMKNTRLPISRASKDLQAHAKDFIKQVKETETELIEPIHSEECRTKNMVDKNKAERQRISEEKERQLIERFNSRCESLFGLGAQFTGDYYQIGNLKVKTERIAEATNEEWNKIFEKLEAENQRLKDVEAEKERELAEAKSKAKEETAKRIELEKKLAEMEAKAEAEADPKQIEEKIESSIAEKIEAKAPEPQEIETVKIEMVKTETVDRVGAKEETETPKPTSITFTDLDSRSPQFNAGFNHCKTMVLDIINNKKTLTQSQLNELVKQLKP